jgi:hypothetical protein
MQLIIRQTFDANQKMTEHRKPNIFSRLVRQIYRTSMGTEIYSEFCLNI